MKKNKITIDGFDPSTFNIFENLPQCQRSKVNKWIRKGYILPAGRPFVNNEEMQLVLDAIRLFDPMLAQICLMSHKYSAHPIFGIAVAHYEESGDYIIGGISNKFHARKILLDQEDSVWFNNYKNVGVDLDGMLLFTETIVVWDEVFTRWNNVMWKLKHMMHGISTISVGSFLYTKLHQVVNNDMDIYDVLKLVRIEHLGILELILQSTGINLSPTIIGEEYCPPNPFEGHEIEIPHLRY